MSEVPLITFGASVWRGDDKEIMASTMNFQDWIGHVWISFPRGEDQNRTDRLRETLVPGIKDNWPATASLPIMPSGAIPLTRNIVHTPSGYEVRAREASKYQR
jgi:hypothetical protein